MHGSVAKYIAVSLAALIAFAPIARADYQVKDGNGNITTIKSDTVSSAVLPAATLVDPSFNPFGVSNNPIFVAPGAGQTFPVSGTITCSNCSGSGVSATFGAAIGTLGAPGGYKDGSGNFQPLLGDVTNGLWVSLKQSVSLGVTGTFWPYTLGQQVASSSVPVALPATQVTALTPPAAITGFALEAGHLASLDTKTPALGQALAASSVPVVLTALQLTALTPPTTLTVQQPTGSNLHMVCDSGCAGSGGTSATFGAAFPTLGTPGGFSQGGNFVAFSGTSGNLNVQCANCSGSGVSTADEATFTAGASLFAGGGGFFQTTATSNPLANGQQGMFQLTANRALFTNLRTAAGVEIGTAASPMQVSLANTAANAAAVKVDGSAVTQPVSGSVTVNAGTNVNTSALSLAATQGTTADAPATLPATVTPASEIALLKAIANAANSPLPIGSASGGMSIKTLPGLTNTAGGTAVKASAGQVFKVQCYNPDATNSALIELFNTASVTLGTTVPFDFVEIGPGQNAGFTYSLVGEQFSTAIQAAGVKTYNTATAPTTALDCTVAFN